MIHRHVSDIVLNVDIINHIFKEKNILIIIILIITTYIILGIIEATNARQTFWSYLWFLEVLESLLLESLSLQVAYIDFLISSGLIQLRDTCRSPPQLKHSIFLPLDNPLSFSLKVF